MLVVQSYYQYQDTIAYFLYNNENIARIMKGNYEVGMWKIKKLK